MKALVSIACGLMLTCVAAVAQGTILFQNIGPGLNASIRMPDGTPLPAGVEFTAELLVGTSPESLAPLTPTVRTTSWVGNGWFGVGQPEKVLPGFAPGSRPWFQVRVFERYPIDFPPIPPRFYGVSAPFQLAALGGLSDPTAQPAIPAPPLFGMQGFYLVPEPSVLALLVVGAATLLLRRAYTGVTPGSLSPLRLRPPDQ